MRKKQVPLAAGLALGVGLVVLLAAAFSGALDSRRGPAAAGRNRCAGRDAGSRHAVGRPCA